MPTTLQREREEEEEEEEEVDGAGKGEKGEEEKGAHDDCIVRSGKGFEAACTVVLRINMVDVVLVLALTALALGTRLYRIHQPPSVA